MAGIVRCTQGDDGEHPGHSDTLLHGLQAGSGVRQSVLHGTRVTCVLQGESAEQRVLVAVLHQAREPGRGHGAAEGEELADLLPVGDTGDSAGPGRGGSGEC